MTLYLGIADYAVLVGMLAISAGIGIFFRFTGGKQKTTQEFLMAGRNMGILPVAFSLMATYMSAVSVLGTTAEVYRFGSQFSSFILGLPIGAVIAAYVYVPIFFDIDASTAYEYLEKRFGKTTRSILSMMFIFQMILYMSIVLYAPSLALNAITGLSTWTSVISLAVVCTLYCSLGGLKAVLWTDVFQSLLMYVTIISMVVKAAIVLGGLDNMWNIANEGGRLIFGEFSTDLTMRYTFWNGLVCGLIFSLATFGANQAQVQRLLSVGSLRRAQWALFLSVPLIIVFQIFCYGDGIAVYSLFRDCDPLRTSNDTAVSSPDQLLPYAIMTMFGDYPGLAGLCVSGVFAASLSTISSAVNSLTAVTMEDFIRPYCFCAKLTESWAAFLAKVIATSYGGFCLCLTVVIANFRGVLEASYIVFGLVSGPILGVFTLGMCTTTANESGTLVGLIIGFGFNVWLSFGAYMSQGKAVELPRSTTGCTDFLNESVQLHYSTSIQPVEVVHLMDNDDGNEVFPLYRVSYVWFSSIGALSVIIIGYVSSFLIRFFTKENYVNEVLISPVFRRWCFPQGKNKIDQTTIGVGIQNTKF